MYPSRLIVELIIRRNNVLLNPADGRLSEKREAHVLLASSGVTEFSVLALGFALACSPKAGEC